jgi:hypothetical protein
VFESTLSFPQNQKQNEISLINLKDQIFQCDFIFNLIKHECIFGYVSGQLLFYFLINRTNIVVNILYTE